MRLKRYFRKVAGGYQISKVLRDLCIFAVQNVTRDPPLSRIDLISCRNLLIYFEAMLQKKVLQLFHYALQPGGFLLLGTSETVGSQADLFQSIDKKPTAGTASLNLYKVVHPDLALELRTIIHSVSAHGGDARKEHARLRVDDKEQRVDIQVLSLGGAIPSECNLMVLFEPSAGKQEPVQAGAQDAAESASGAKSDDRYRLLQCNAELERELDETCGYIQSVIEEQEGTNEALHAADEEVQSANEELQSANEELETAKEELQSINEELATVNEELENRNGELAQSNNDLVNLLTSVSLPILILGPDLRIRQFTQPAERLLNLIDSDVGRPIGNIKPNLEIPSLEHVALEVIESMNTKELELKDNQGHWHSVRIRPYKTIDNRIDGVTIVFIDIENVKRLQGLQEELREERRLATVVRDSNDAVTVQDLDGTIRAWNPAAERIYGYSEQEALGMNIRSLVAPQDQPKLDQLLLDMRAGRSSDPLFLRRIAKDGRVLRVLVSASALLDESGRPFAVATTERESTASPPAGGANEPGFSLKPDL